MLIVSKKKPNIKELKSICNFMSSKNFLWNITREFLYENTIKEHNVLDAASSYGITREIFPECFYYGIDIEIKRIKSAVALSTSINNSDRFYLGDLTSEGGLIYQFDGIVSLNTLSHIYPSILQKTFNNITSAVKSGGYLAINTNIGHGSSELARLLQENFENVNVIYTESKKSIKDEERPHKVINKNNIIEKTIENEIHVPNQANIHKQILFLATKKVGMNKGIIQNKKSPLRTSSINKVALIGTIIHTKRVSFKDDTELIEALKNHCSKPLLISRKLANHETGHKIISAHQKIYYLDSLPTNTIDDLSSCNQSIVVCGLETGWEDDHLTTRHCLNRIRKHCGLIIFTSSKRDGLNLRTTDIARFG